MFQTIDNFNLSTREKIILGYICGSCVSMFNSFKSGYFKAACKNNGFALEESERFWNELKRFVD